jgi:NAD(P)-dependent dehydrogenase (short-subunit alcohol dehydrogenase family)
MTESRVALITGGTDGIGKATAAQLLGAGWDVVVVGRDPSRCASPVAELRAAAGSPSVSAITADLSLMSATKRASEEFLAGHERLDFLFLNANAIAQRRELTSEGFERNFALGYLSRALLALELEDVLAATAGSQILSVVGLNKSRLDFDDLSMQQGFSGMKALGRWQWAVQVFAREFERRSPVPMNIYMPGIVKTKILRSEPNVLMRTMIRAVYAVKAASVEDSAGYVLGVMRDIEDNGRRDAYYSVKTLKPRRDLEDQPGDQETLWTVTDALLAPYRQGVTT